MTEYYGTQQSSDFFAHYGIRGMKWGVRKALSQNKALMSEAYARAQKKLQSTINAGTAVGKRLYKNDKGPKAVVYLSPNKLKRKALSASTELELARQRRDHSFLGRHGFGRTARAYREAHQKAANATTAYYNSLSKKQYEKLRRNHIG